jgi:glycosyltransferase involved in cell wall biosynthesis
MASAKKGSRPTLLVVGAYVAGSGFARVMQHVIADLRDEMRVHYFGIDYSGPPHPHGGVEVHPGAATAADPYGTRRLQEVARTVRPSLVFLLHDLWYLARYLPALAEVGGGWKTVVYTPLDGDIENFRALSPLRYVDHCVFYTRYGQEGVERFLDEWQEREGPVPTPRFSILPHGVDTDTFRPWPGSVEEAFDGGRRLEAKQAVFPQLEKPEDSFIVLNANRPSPRKRIDLTLAGFARFAQGKPANVKLYLHQTKLTPRLRTQIFEAAARHGLRDRLIQNPIVKGRSEVDDSRLNLIYNACDVGVNTSMGEGWGLVSFEHAATGAPQIVPRHTACGELWDGAAAFLEPVAEGKPWFSPYRMYAVSADDLAARLEEIYEDRGRRRELALAGYRRATEPRFRWPRISSQWADLFGRTLAA